MAKCLILKFVKLVQGTTINDSLSTAKLRNNVRCSANPKKKGHAVLHQSEMFHFNPCRNSNPRINFKLDKETMDIR